VLLAGIDGDGRVYIVKEFYQSHITNADLAQMAKRDFSPIARCGCMKYISYGPGRPCSICGHQQTDHMQSGESDKCNAPVSSGVKFIADSADPGGIEEFKKAGLNCTGVSKVAGEREESYVMGGVKDVSGYLEIQGDGKPRLFVCATCVNTIMEFENYAYPDSKDGKIPAENPDKPFSHSMDALRYLVQSMSKKKKFIMAFV
jgi:hypothetical protein